MAKSLCGLHPVGVEQLSRLGRALTLLTGQRKDKAADHLISWVFLTLMKGLASLLLDR